MKDDTGFTKKIENKYIFVEGELVSIEKKNGQVIGVSLLENDKIMYYSTSVCVICAGGYGNIFQGHDNVKDNGYFNAHGVCIDAGIKMRNLEGIMYHPFGKINNSELIEYMCTKTDTLANKSIQGNEMYAHIYEKIQFILDSHNAHQNFGILLQYFYKIKEILIDDIVYKPVVHYTLGGIEIDKHFMTNISGIFSYGEASVGISGASRIGGVALSEIFVFSEIISKEIDLYILNKVNQTEELSKHVPLHYDFSKIKEVKNELKNIFSFHNIYGIQNLELIGILNQIENMYDCSYKSIAKAIILSIQKRQESRGLLYRSDYPKKKFFPYVIFYQNGKVYKRYVNIFYKLKYYIYKKYFNF